MSLKRVCEESRKTDIWEITIFGSFPYKEGGYGNRAIFGSCVTFCRASGASVRIDFGLRVAEIFELTKLYQKLYRGY